MIYNMLQLNYYHRYTNKRVVKWDCSDYLRKHVGFVLIEIVDGTVPVKVRDVSTSFVTKMGTLGWYHPIGYCSHTQHF